MSSFLIFYIGFLNFKGINKKGEMQNMFVIVGCSIELLLKLYYLTYDPWVCWDRLFYY